MALEIDDDDNQCDEAPAWLTTYSDLVTLLLTFFVLLVSMSTVDSKKFNTATSSIRESFGGTEKSAARSEFEATTETSDIVEMMKVRNEMMQAQQALYNEVRSFITENGMEGKVGAVLEDGVVTLKVPGAVLFEPASEDLSPEGIANLKILSEFFKTHREQFINIRGYSDNSPIPTDSRYKDNWELSSLRALNVLRWLLENGIAPTRMTATGLGELDPIAPNDSEVNRAKNRRVEFLLERKVGV